MDINTRFSRFGLNCPYISFMACRTQFCLSPDCSSCPYYISGVHILTCIEGVIECLQIKYGNRKDDK